MKTHSALALALLLVCGCQSKKFNERTTLQIENYRQGAKAAISYTFDDGCRNQFEKAVPLFDSLDFHLTMFLTTNWITDWDGVRNAAASGHEIGCHTLTHLNLAELDTELVVKELGESKAKIEGEIPGYVCKTIAYPFCSPCDSNICSQYFFAARHCQGYIEENGGVKSFMNISSLGCGDQSLINSAEELEKQFDAALEKQGWCTLLFHGIDNDGGYSPIAYEELRKSAMYLKENSRDYWTASFGEVAMYIKERQSSRINIVSNDDRQIVFTLDDNLEDDYYNMPLTLSLDVPEGVESVLIKDENNAYTVTAAQGKVLFDVLPDGKSVSVKI